MDKSVNRPGNPGAAHLDVVQVPSDGSIGQFRSGAVEPGGHAIDLPHEVVGRRCRNPGHVSMDSVDGLRHENLD